MNITMSTTTTRTRKQAARSMAALALAALLAGCSGSDDSAEASATAADARKVPTSALSSTRAFSEYVGSLAATEVGETLLVDADMVAPKSETEQAIAVQ